MLVNVTSTGLVDILNPDKVRFIEADEAERIATDLQAAARIARQREAALHGQLCLVGASTPGGTL